jgi:hypothetical protein
MSESEKVQEQKEQEQAAFSYCASAEETEKQARLVESFAGRFVVEGSSRKDYLRGP